MQLILLRGISTRDLMNNPMTGEYILKFTVNFFFKHHYSLLQYKHSSQTDLESACRTILDVGNVSSNIFLYIVKSYANSHPQISQNTNIATNSKPKEDPRYDKVVIERNWSTNYQDSNETTFDVYQNRKPHILYSALYTNTILNYASLAKLAPNKSNKISDTCLYNTEDSLVTWTSLRFSALVISSVFGAELFCAETRKKGAIFFFSNSMENHFL